MTDERIGVSKPVSKANLSQKPDRSQSRWTCSGSSGSGSGSGSSNSCVCHLGSGSCSSSSSCSYCCCGPSAAPKIFHLKELVCEDAFSETFKSPFAPKCVKLPGWLTNCGKILCFHAYYQEPIPESPIENYRIHQCQIRFYLEDDTIEVIEPPTFDPGYTQGRIIRRGKIPLPPPAETENFTLDHLNVGCEVTFYAKTFYICGCDAFTRRYMNRLGYPVPADTELPIDLATIKRQDLVLSQFARKAGFNPEMRKAGKFFINNRKVLRFWAMWDDRCSLYGRLRKFVVHYFLEDDTLEIKEILEPNSGFYPNPAFLCRSRVPKNPNKPYPLPGVKEEALRILNVLGSGECNDGYTTYSYITDRLCPGINEEECYTAADLTIGATLNIYGRCFILTECDEFTKKYYRDKYRVADFTPLVLNERKYEPPSIIPPPHSGIGSEEDTLANWNKVEISPPRKDELKFLLSERDVVSFNAQFYDAQQQVNAERRFVVKYFLVDQTIQILEQQHPSSGFRRGIFLSRTRLKKEKGHEGNGFTSVYFLPEDFFIGRIIELNGYIFQLTSADEYSLSYMELHKDQFPHSNICNVLNKVREVFGPVQASDVLNMFACNDPYKIGIIDFTEFRATLLDLSKCNMSDHEIITLQRAYKALPPPPGIDFDALRAIIQTELRRFNFDKILVESTLCSLGEYDPCATGLMDRETLRSILRGAKVPVAKELIDFLIDRYPPGDDCNRVKYCEIVDFLNWEGNPVVDAKQPEPVPNILEWLEPKSPNEIKCVNYRALLHDVCPNFKCSLPEICCDEPVTIEASCPEICNNDNDYEEGGEEQDWNN